MSNDGAGRGSAVKTKYARGPTTAANVASVPGEPFGSPGHIRFNFAVQEAVLRASGMPTGS